MKKVLAAIICLAMVLSLTVFAYAETEGDFTYNVVDGKATITGYTGSGGAVTIPATLGGYPVTAIGHHAFKNRNMFTSVVISDGITSIGVSAFEGGTSLTSISIPDSVTIINNYAFFGCTGLTAVVIPDSVTYIGLSAFFNCSALASITVSGSATSVDSSAFDSTAYYNNSENWEDGVLYIGKYLYSAKRDISGKYTIKDGTVSICSSAFNNCKALTSVTIPDSVTEIGAYAFCASGLTAIVIPDSVTVVDTFSFMNCSALASITIPDSVTNVGGCAFENTVYYNNSENWKDGVLYIGNHLIKAKTDASGEYVIKDGTVSVSDSAFNQCKGFTSIAVPDSVKNIGEYAFNGCSALASITISNSVTSIGDGVFMNCASLTSIAIPDRVTHIGEIVFYGCTGLKSIYVYNENCAFENTAGVPTTTTIYSYKDSLAEAYATKNGIPIYTIALLSITVSALPTKTTYFVGDRFVPDGIVVTARYKNSENNTVTAELSTPDMTTAGTKTVTVTYKGKIFSFNITVNAVEMTGISVTALPTKTNYFVGDSFDMAGLVVTANYNNGATETVTAELSAPDMTTAGTKTITVTYEGKTDTFDITVNAVEMTEISVTTLPTKLDYFVGDTFDSTGLVVTASYNNDSTKTVTAELSVPDMTTAGIKKITVTYGSLTESFYIKVSVRYRTGDVDLSGGTPTIADALTLFKHVAGVEIITDAEAIEVADVDGTAGVTIADALTLFKFVAGVISEL